MYAGFAEQAERARAQSVSDRVAGTSPSHPLEDYAGTYVDALYGEIAIRADGEGLVFTAGELRAELAHWHYDTFLGHWSRRWMGESPFTFATGGDGSIRSVEVFGRTFARSPSH